MAPYDSAFDFARIVYQAETVTNDQKWRFSGPKLFNGAKNDLFSAPEFLPSSPVLLKAI